LIELPTTRETAFSAIPEARKLFACAQQALFSRRESFDYGMCKEDVRARASVDCTSGTARGFACCGGPQGPLPACRSWVAAMLMPERLPQQSSRLACPVKTYAPPSPRGRREDTRMTRAVKCRADTPALTEYLLNCGRCFRRGGGRCGGCRGCGCDGGVAAGSTITVRVEVDVRPFWSMTT
jgi:hypothetical protein